MNVSLRWLILIYWAVGLMPSVQAAPNALSEPVLIVAGDNFAPWSFKDDRGQSVGIDVDILRAIGANLGYPVEIKHFPAKRVGYFVAQGEAVLQLMPVLQGQLLEVNTELLLVGSSEFYRAKVSGISMVGKIKPNQGWQQLKGFRFGHLNTLNSIESALLFEVEHRIQVASIQQLLKTLLAERIDIALSDEPALYYYADQLQVASSTLQAVYHAPSLSVIPVWSKAALADFPASLPEDFSASLLKLKRQGVVTEIINRYSDQRFFVTE